MGYAFILLLVVPLPVLWLISHTILYPTVVAAQKVRGPFRFQLLDFVALVFQIQLVLGPIMAWTSGEEVSFQRKLFLTVGIGATVAMWLAAVSFLSKAGIQQGLRRAIFILIYLPGTVAVLVGGPSLLGWWIMIPDQRPQWVQTTQQLMGGVIGVVAVSIAAGFGLRKLGEWLVK